MPSRTLTPDPPTTADQHTPPEPPGTSGQHTPPESPGTSGQHTRPESLAFSELRLVTVPAGWPPYDCETHGAACPAAREAAASNPHASHLAPALAEPPGLAAPSPAPDQSAAGQTAASQTSARHGTALPRQYAHVIVEILAGSRPVRQTVGWTTDRVRAQIGDLTQLLASDQRPKIKRVVTSQPAASVVEMTVVVTFGARSRALAMRFEHMPARQPKPGLPARPARWLCTELETG